MLSQLMGRQTQTPCLRQGFVEQLSSGGASQTEGSALSAHPHKSCLPSPTPLYTGWIFGERLHDQERGWFPSSMTEEILNPKIRSQNLKECFRVHKMDDPQRSQNKDRRKLGSRNRQ